MSLFGQLRRLHLHERFQLEDFHTEITAQVLRDSPLLTHAWLHRIQATALPSIDSYTIETQETFPALAGHETDSRPDMVIRVSGAGRKELIFVESKVGASAGHLQIDRYLAHLADQRTRGLSDRATLVFITRVFEADYAEELAQQRSLPPGVAFRQTRWFEFHRLLLPIIKNNPLAAQLALFMQENYMNLRHQFRPLDLVALENFLAVKSLMDETLDGKVRQTFSEKLQDATTLARALKQLQEHSRYVIYTATYPVGHFEGMLGYFLPEDEADGGTGVNFAFNCGPGSPARKEYIEAFHKWSAQGRGWVVENDDNDHEWCSLVKWRPLTSFLSEDDHVEAIRTFMLQLIEEATEFLAANPHLPWRDENKQ